MKVWKKNPDPNNKYGATFTLGESDTDLPETAIISVTRGEKFDLIRIIINGIVNEFVKKQLTKNENLIYAKLSGQLQGGIGQTVTIWRDRESMNRFRTTKQYIRRESVGSHMKSGSSPNPISTLRTASSVRKMC
ncbi:hypothetical protein [Paenibacillus alvei]|uniref:hypothetical protein n=1 Tax=Paenibacillus alvei TaxID=44250 RepID=UPI001C10D04B|nr:hypothetical protein [Paenibacillus alvei]